MKRENPIPKAKVETVKQLTELLLKKKTILIVSIKNIPASQYQEITKKLRAKAIVKVPKKNLLFMAIDSTKKQELEKLKQNIKDSTAILFSDLDCFDLALDLEESKSPAKAKAGQEAPEDIEIQEGPTELVPGPAISELGALGIQIQIEKGKIHIKEPKVIAKKGEKISPGAADLMGKLDIKPFSIGFIPLSAFDTQEGKLYPKIDIGREDAVKKLKHSYERALPFAVAIGYSSEQTIRFLLSKALAHAKALEKLSPVEETTKEETTKEKEEEPKEEEKSEEITKDSQTQENKTEEENKN